MGMIIIVNNRGQVARLPVRIQVSTIIIIISKAGVASKVSLRNCKSFWRLLKAQAESPTSSWTVWRAPSVPSPAPCAKQARRESASCRGKLTLIARSGRTAVIHWQQRGMLLTPAGSAWSVLVLPFPVLNVKGKRQAIGFYMCFYYIYPTIHFSYINPNIFSDCPSVVVDAWWRKPQKHLDHGNICLWLFNLIWFLSAHWQTILPHAPLLVYSTAVNLQTLCTLCLLEDDPTSVLRSKRGHLVWFPSHCTYISHSLLLPFTSENGKFRIILKHMDFDVPFLDIIFIICVTFL